MLHIKIIAALLGQLVLIVHAKALDRVAKTTTRNVASGLVAMLRTAMTPTLASASATPALPADETHDEVLALIGATPEPTIELELSEIEVLEISSIHDWIEAAPEPIFD